MLIFYFPIFFNSSLSPPRSATEHSPCLGHFLSPVLTLSATITNQSRAFAASDSKQTWKPFWHTLPKTVMLTVRL